MKKLGITEEKFKEAYEKCKIQKEIAEYLKISQPSVSNYMRKFGLIPKLIGKTPKNELYEMPEHKYEALKKHLENIYEKSVPDIGYGEIDIEIQTDRPVFLVPIADVHFGARYIYYKKFFKDIDFIKNNPMVYTLFCGDFCDNYTTDAYKNGQIEAAMKIQDQKAAAKSIVEKLSDTDSLIAILNGCHDEWSYLNDGFDLGQSLAHKKFAYYMGHGGIINLTVGKNTYRIKVRHNTYRNSSKNEGHGLKEELKEGSEFDIGISAHKHKPHVEEFVLREKIRYIMACGTYKGRDRHTSKKGYPKTVYCTPGMLLYPNKKKIILNIDYQNLIEYI